MKTLILVSLFSSLLNFIIASTDVRIYHQQIDQEFQIFVDNDNFCTISVKLNFNLENMVSSKGNYRIFLIPAKSFNYEITSLKVIDSFKRSRFNYNYNWNYGNVKLNKYDINYNYSLPFEKGKGFKIAQGYNNRKGSHKGVNALDFWMPIGSKVCASREGIVIKTEASHTKNCFKKKCAKYNNYVIVKHTDGTFSNYLHLDTNRVVVKEGEKIEKGQLLGYSGNTGYSGGPHLHFSVYIPRLGKNDYLETYFLTQKNKLEILKESSFYKREF